MDAQELFLDQLPLIERVTTFVCRRNHLDPDEGEDFASHVKLKLIESNYAIIRKFEGRSTFGTYLTTVIQRMFYQYRVHLWGKWRPSAEARRLGEKGILLERLLSRDGYSIGEATEMLTTGDEPMPRAEVEMLHLRLPMRNPRPILVSEATLADSASLDDGPDEELLSREHQKSKRAALASIGEMIDAMATEDQTILRMRFWNAQRVPDIARVLGLDQRRVYKRIDKMMTKMRRKLESAGFHRNDIRALLPHDHEAPSRPPIERGENPLPRPSHRVDGTFGSGKSRLSG